MIWCTTTKPIMMESVDARQSRMRRAPSFLMIAKLNRRDMRKSIDGIRLSRTVARAERTSSVISHAPSVYSAIEPNITSTMLGNHRKNADGRLGSTQTRRPHRPNRTAMKSNPPVIDRWSPVRPTDERNLAAVGEN